MGVVALLQPDPRLKASVARALASEHDVRTCASWGEVGAALTNGDVDALVVDADYPAPSTAISELRQLRDEHDVAVLVWTEGGSPERFFELGGAGVYGLLQPKARSFTIRNLVSTSIAETRGRAAAGMLPDRWPDQAKEAVRWAVANAPDRPLVRDLAGSIGIGQSRLREVLRRSALPTPNQVLLWGRLILAGARFEDPNRTVESVAYSLGYATSGALSRAFRRHTGLTAGQIREGGGMEAVVHALLRRHRQGREAAPAQLLPRTTSTLATLLLLLTTACASSGSVDRTEVQRLLDTPPLDQLHAGVLAVDARTGRTLFAHNDRRRFIPASNQKVLVTATALSLLGADYRFRTDVFAQGPLRDGVLDGDLVLRPSGDPSLSSRYWDSGGAALRSLADSISKAGVSRVAGRVRIDATAWDSVTIGPTWEFADLPYRYGATGSVFAIDEGEVAVVVRAGMAPGEAASVSWTPGSEEFIRARVETVHSDSTRNLHVSYLPESRRLVLHGHVPAGRTDTLRIAQRDPMGVAVAEASNAFSKAGIEVEGGWGVDWPEQDGACDDARRACVQPLATIWSPPLSELVAGILEPSQNWMTEQLVRTLGARFGSRGSWSEGTGVMEAYLVNEVGVSSTDLSARDGSGLSAYNLVTPRAVVRILQEMADGPFAAEFRSAMAEPSEEGSTLESRLEGFEGRLFAKTGTISNVNSLSGYLVRDDGQEVIFSILTNGSGLPASRVRPAIDEIVRELSRTTRRP